MIKYLSLLLLLISSVAFADAPVIWNGTTAKWLPSGLHSAGVCTTDSAGVQSIYTTNGILKLSSGALSSAVSGTDYAPATSGTALLKGNGSGGFSSAVANTDYLPATSGSAIQKANGSGGLTAATSGTDYAPATSGSSILYGNGSGGFSAVTVGTGLDFTGGTLSSTVSGTVTTLSVASANGFAGTVANATTTPAITLSTTITGLLKGNGTAISAASAGTDYAPATSGSSILKGNGSGGFSSAVAGTDYVAATSGSAIQKANGSGGLTAATSGTDYAPATSGSSILKGNGSGGFSNAASGTDYAPATSGTSLLKGNGSGGFSNAASGTDYAPATSGTSILYGNGSGGFSNATIGTGLSFAGGTLSASGGSSTANDYTVYLSNPTGYGSTNTKIRTYGRIVKNTASGYITLTQSATNGDSLTAAVDGLFAACTGDFRATSDMSVILTIDDSAMTTNGRTPLTYAQGGRIPYLGVSTNDSAQSCDIFNLNAGQVVRSHSDGNNSATDQAGYLYMRYLGPKVSSSLYLDGGNGYGSTNTLIRRWTNVQENIGTAFTVTDSATLGETITINEDGTYWMCRGEGRSSAGNSFIGSVIVNDGSVSNTTPYSYSYSSGNRLTIAQDVNYYTANNVGCGFFKFSNGDVLRAHDASSGLSNGTNAMVFFRMIKISGTSKVMNASSSSTSNGSVSTHLRYYGNLNRLDSAYLGFADSSAGGSALIANVSGVFGACEGDYAASAMNPGIAVNPRIGTANLTTMNYNDGFRGYRKFGGTSSTYFHCAFDYLNVGGQMYEQLDSTGGSDSFISFTGAKLD